MVNNVVDCGVPKQLYTVLTISAYPVVSGFLARYTPGYAHLISNLYPHIRFNNCFVELELGDYIMQKESCMDFDWVEGGGALLQRFNGEYPTVFCQL